MPLRTEPPLPRRLIEVADYRTRRFKRDERALAASLTALFTSVFPGFVEEIDRKWIKSFVTRMRADGKAEQVWDFFKAAQIYTVPELIEHYDEMIAAVGLEAGHLLDTEVTDGLTEGYLLGMWTLNEGGLDVEEAPPPPTTEQSRNLLMVLGLGGITYMNRLSRWVGEARDKGDRWLRASVFGEFTRGDTVETLGYLYGSMANRVVGLGGDELYRAYNLGQTAAFQQFPGFVAGEIWLTQEDERVCPICRPLHWQITWMEPIKDTHPNCRCQKVPIVTDEKGGLLDTRSRTPTEYADFRRRYLRR